MELESVHAYSDARPDRRAQTEAHRLDLENAVIVQELMAVKVTLAGKCVELLPFDSAGTDGCQGNSCWKMCRVIAL